MTKLDGAYKLGESPVGLLPVGLYDEKSGTYIREIEVDEWTGIDQEKLTSPVARKNPNKAFSNVLSRVIQSIGEGETAPLKTKTNRFVMCDSRHVDCMFQVDRDYTLLLSLIVSGDYEKEMEFDCGNCGAELIEDIDLRELDVVPHDHTEPPIFYFELPRGVKNSDGVICKEAKFKLPTGKEYSALGRYHKEGVHAVASALFSKTITIEGFGLLSIESARRMSKRDRDAILKVLGDKIPGVEMTREVSCSSCGDNTILNIDVGQFFQ